MPRNRAEGRIGYDRIDYDNPRPPDYYTQKEGGIIELWTGSWHWPLIHPNVYSLFWGSPHALTWLFARWDRVNGWTDKPKEVFV